MKTKFYTGFITYDFGDSNFLFVDVHPTTSLEIMPREDIGADLIAVRLARAFGGKAVVTTMPRDREYGIDFNRLPTPENLALKMFNSFLVEKDNDAIAAFEKKYAWAANDRSEHEQKKKIYDSFWSTVGGMTRPGSFLAFIHVQDITLRNFPSIVDTIPLSGLKLVKIKDAIKELNKKYASVFDSIKKDVAEFLVFDAKHQFRTAAMQTFGSLNPDSFSGNMKEKHEKMLERILELGFDSIYSDLKNSYSFEKHVAVAEKIANDMPVRITLMKNFHGELALGTKRFLSDLRLKRKIKIKAIEFEVSGFLSEIYTDLGAEILESFVKALNIV